MAPVRVWKEVAARPGQRLGLASGALVVHEPKGVDNRHPLSMLFDGNVGILGEHRARRDHRREEAVGEAVAVPGRQEIRSRRRATRAACGSTASTSTRTETTPVAPNVDAMGRAQNRRVELVKR